MVSKDVVGKSMGESAVNTIVNLAKEAKLSRENVKAAQYVIGSVLRSLITGGVAGGV